jgi:hypothetical protein
MENKRMTVVITGYEKACFWLLTSVFLCEYVGKPWQCLERELCAGLFATACVLSDAAN